MKSPLFPTHRCERERDHSCSRRNGRDLGWRGRLDIIVRDGVIAELGEASDARDAKRIDAGGCVVLPGCIDMHTHVREPSKIDREGFLAGTSSAVAGGITTIGEMPQAQPLVENLETLALKRGLAEAHSICDIALDAAEDARRQRPEASARIDGTGRGPP